MLAAHRDQENLVLSHQVPTKQAPKTPGIRYPKTPSRFGQRDENGQTGLGKKSEIVDGKHFTNRLSMMTPIAPQTRIVLGNKTTNAKARTAQGKAGGVKDVAKEVEKSQIQQSTIRKSKEKQASSRKLFLTTQRESEPDFDEPEYAPPRPQPLPYQSDVLPDGGLTFEGIKKENIFRGYYRHFIDPLDDDGVSRMEKLLDKEMAAVLENAMQRNEMETDAFSWNAADVSGELDHDASESNDAPTLTNSHVRIASERNISTMSSYRAAAALATTSITSQSKNSSGPTKKPAISKARSNESQRPIDPAVIPRCASSAGEAASRTTIRNTKGWSTSSALHDSGEDDLSRHARAMRTIPIFSGEDARLTITPARLRQIASEREDAELDNVRSHFSSNLSEDYDDIDLPLMSIPFEESDGDEEFVMKLDF